MKIFIQPDIQMIAIMILTSLVGAMTEILQSGIITIPHPTITIITIRHQMKTMAAVLHHVIIMAAVLHHVIIMEVLLHHVITAAVQIKK